MNEVEPMTLDHAALVVAIVILLGSVLAWLRRIKHGPIEHAGIPAPEILPWSRNWVDFGLVFWALVMVYVALVMVIIRFVFPVGFDLRQEVSGAHPLSWYTIFYSTSIQLALLVTVLGAKYSYGIKLFEQPTLGSSPLIGLERLLRYMPLLWLAAGLSVWLTRALGISSGEQEAVTMMQGIDHPGKFLAMVFLAVVAAPILEEIFFRGLLLRFLTGYAGKTTALIISSVLFAALHFNTDSIIPISILGFLLGKVYLDTGDLKTSIWMHTFFNLQSVLVISIEKWISLKM